MNKCVICNEEIKNDSQFINGNWYHNDCIESLNNTIAKLEQENKAYKDLVNELQKVVNGELVPEYCTTNEKAKKHFYEGYSLLKDFIEDRINKFIGE